MIKIFKETGRVSIIIATITYNLKVKKLVKILKAQTIISNDIIVVAKSLPRNNVSRKVSNSGNLVRIFKQKGKGIAEACNLGVMHSKEDILVFIDDDCVPFDNRWLSHLVEEFSLDQELGLVSGRIIVPQNSLIQSFIRKMNGLGTPDFGSKDFYIQNRFIAFPRTNMAVRKSTFNKLSGFDETLTVAEDVDFCIRAYQKSVKAKYASSPIIYHFHRNTLGSLFKHAWRTGKGSAGFIRKYGLWNKFLRGTSICFLSIFFIPLILLVFISVLVGTIESIFLIPLIIPYFIFIRKFWEGKPSLQLFLFPLILAIYSITLGLGLLYQLIFRRETNK